MREWLVIYCPACWQKQEVDVEDPGNGEVEMVTDCEICCRPMNLRIWRGMDDQLEADISSAND